jgi:DNA processing protein
VSAHAATPALIALLRRGRRQWSAYAEEVETTGDVHALLEEELGLFVADALDQAAADLKRWAEQGIQVLSVFDPEYPENLRAVNDRPPLIFVAGELRRSDARSVAVIGSRQASPAGLARAQEISGQLVAHGYTVTSGLAAGIDSAAHLTALDGGGRTIAVIGTGVLKCYPRQNEALQRRIAREGAVVSRFWPEAPPTRKSFPLRNAVMSGISLATVIVEASQTSGARTQARLALAHGRPVLLTEALLSQDWARQLAMRPGTHVLSSPAALPQTIERIAQSGTLVA